MGPRAGLDGCGKFPLPPGFDPQTVATRYVCTYVDIFACVVLCCASRRRKYAPPPPSVQGVLPNARRFIVSESSAKQGKP